MGEEELVEKDAEEGLGWWERNSVAVGLVVEELDGVEEDAKGKLPWAHAWWWGSTLGKLELVENGVSMGIARVEVDGVEKDSEEGMGVAGHCRRR
jgi:hypothetical protein